jgi:hypothetical protein
MVPSTRLPRESCTGGSRPDVGCAICEFVAFLQASVPVVGETRAYDNDNG